MATQTMVSGEGMGESTCGTVLTAAAQPAGNTVANATESAKPLMPCLADVPVFPCDELVEYLVETGEYDLSGLGATRAHALGFLSALLDRLTHRAALRACGLPWGVVANWSQMSEGYRRLYHACRNILEEHRVQLLRDAAYERAVEGVRRGVWHNGAKVGDEIVYSDKLTELLLKGMDPETFGRVEDRDAGQRVQINITL